MLNDLDRDVRQAMRRLGDGSIVHKLEKALLVEKRKREEAERDEKLLEAWITFHKGTHVAEYSTEWRVFQIDDGEMYWIVAKDYKAAVDYIAENVLGEPPVDFESKVLPPEYAIEVFEEGSRTEVDIRSCAEWASVGEVMMIATTVN